MKIHINTKEDEVVLKRMQKYFSEYENYIYHTDFRDLENRYCIWETEVNL
jgi:hypothetical protein